VALLHQPLPAGFLRAQFFPGPHNLTFVVEDVVPTDSNPSNNEVALALDVLAPPTSKWPRLPVDHAPVAGQNITFLVVVRNVGATRGSAYVEVWDGEPRPATARG